MTENESSSRDDRVNDVILLYLQAVERGEAVDREKFLAEHAEIAEELKSFFGNQAQFQQVAEAVTLPPVASIEQPSFDPDKTTLVAATPSFPSVGEVVRYFGDYELLQEIARGGMGVVYKARQINLNKIVALKMILAGELAGPQDVQRFYTEAEAAAQLDHPGIVPVFEVGQHQGQHFFSMGFVDGKSLAARVAEGPLPAREAAELVRDVALAVQYAHDKGVIHRDLKPGNILLDKDGHPRVTDFGLAKLTKSDSDLTGTGQILGTPSYMPPEQAAGKTDEIGPAADIYALGAILYCLLTGRPPFQAASSMDTLLQVMDQDPVPLRQLNHRAPLDLETITLKCLEKDIARRYGAARQLADELQRFLDGRPILARPVGRFERSWRWCRRNPTVAGLIGVTAISLISATIISNYYAALAGDRAVLADNRAAKLRMSLARNYFERGVREYDSGRLESCQADLTRALAISSPNDPLYGSYCRVLVDRCIQGGKQFVPPLFHTGSVVSVAFSPDGTRVVTGTRDQARLWDARTGFPIGEAMHEGAQVAFSADGATVLTRGERFEHLWDAQNGARLEIYPRNPFLNRKTVLSGKTVFSSDSSLAAGIPWVWDKSANAVSSESLKSVVIWDSHTGAPVGQAMPHDGEVDVIAFSPDAAQILTVRGNVIRRWDVKTGMPLGEPMTHRTNAKMGLRLYLSADGQRALSVVGNNGINRCTSQLWNASTGTPVGELQTHEAQVRTVMFSPDSKRFFMGTFGNGARMWDSDTGNPIGELMQHPLTVTCVAFNSNGTRLVTGGEDRIAQVRDGYSGLPIGEEMKHDAAIFTVAFSPDGTRIATTSSDYGLRLWDARSGTLIGEPMKHGGRILSLAFSSDGAQVVTGAADKTARIWDVSTCSSVEEVARYDQVTRYDARIECFNPDSSRCFATNYDYSTKLWNSAKICDAQTGARVGAFIKVPDGSLSGNFSPDSEKILIRNSNGTAQLWNAKTGQPTGKVLNNFGEFLEFSPDSSRILTRGKDGALCLWDPQTTLPIAKLMEHEGPVWCVAFSPDGTRVAAGSRDNFARLFDGRTGTPVGEALKHEQPVYTVAFSPDGKRLLTGSYDETARLWDAFNGQPIGAAMKHESWVQFAKFSPDGARIVTKSNKALRLWNAYTGSSVGKGITHGAGIDAVAFSPDGTRIATSNEDAFDPTVQLWDLANGTAVGELMRHGGKITQLAFTASGTHVLTGSYDHTVRLWDGFTGARLLEPIKFNGFYNLAYSTDGSRIGTWLLQDIAAPNIERLSSVERRSIFKSWTGYDADEDGTLHQLSPAEVDDLRRQVGESDPLRKFGVARRMRHVAVACWEKVRTKSESDEGYRNALDDAKSLVLFDPSDLDYQVTLGTAQFRVGAWQAALETLTDADRRSRKTTGGPLPACMAVLAMTHQKLGHSSEAIACLQDLRQRFPQGTYDVGLRELVFEAEWVLNTGKYQWKPLDIDEMHSQGAATLTKLEDGSIRVSGANPNSEIYNITSTVNMPRITALRLETLRDQSLPDGGPGRSPTNGNFALTKISVTATDRSDESRVVKCVIGKAIADFTQIGHDVQDVIDGRTNNGWAVLHANGKTFDGALVLEFAQPLLIGNGVRLQVSLEHNSAWNWHALGRFRLSVSGTE